MSRIPPRKPGSTRYVAINIALLLLAACGQAKHPSLDLRGIAMGTTYNVTIVDTQSVIGDPPDVAAVLERLNLQFSTYEADSALSSFNEHDSTEWVSTTADLCNGLANAGKISARTGGAFDVTVGNLVNLWGFGPDDIVLEPPTDDSIQQARETTGYTKIETRCDENLVRKDQAGIYVDLSGYAKGIAVDAVADRLAESGYANFLVELGGEIRAHGHNAHGRPWRIAIERPSDEDRAIETALNISGSSLATSGDYRNYFEYAGRRYSHTIDPRTGHPIEHETASVTVVDSTTAGADALATALLVMGHEDGYRFATENSIAAYFLVRRESDFDALVTPRFSLFLQDPN